jgi:prepilin-type N-terminal cleavage/methylation domain-containing protein
MSQKHKKGFTLIELLVVISIISLLSSIVLTTLGSARNKAKDVAVKQGVREFEKLLQLEYQETGDYSNLQSCAWIPVSAQNCDSMFAGSNYRVQAVNICNNILSNGNKEMWGGYALFICNSIDAYSRYSIMASLRNNKWFCAGNSGSSDNVYYWASRVDSSNVSLDTTRSTWPDSPVGCTYNP